MLRFEMWLAFFLRAHFPALSLVALITSSVANAQGPAPSPLIQNAPAPSKDAAAPTQPSPAPALTRQDLEPFLDALISSATVWLRGWRYFMFSAGQSVRELFF